MKALVLAAGLGERLRPLTDHAPKPMIEIGGKPILEHNIRLLAKAEITDVIINLHHYPDMIVEYFEDGGAFGVNIEYSWEAQLLGTAGAARKTADRLRDDDFLVIYGDNLSTIDLGKLIVSHREKHADFTMALFKRDDVQSSGIVAFDSDNRITRFLEKPKPEDTFSHWVNAGYYIIKPWILNFIPADRPSDFGRDVLPALLASDAHVNGYCMTEQLWWIDSLVDYENTREEFTKIQPN